MVPLMDIGKLSSGFEEPKVVGLVLYVKCLRVLQIKGCMLVEVCGKQLVILAWSGAQRNRNRAGKMAPPAMT